MTSAQSLRIYELTLEFIKDKDKVKEYVTRIVETIEQKFIEKEKILASKQDLSEAKVDIIKWMVGTSMGVVALIVALVKFI